MILDNIPVFKMSPANIHVFKMSPENKLYSNDMKV